MRKFLITSIIVFSLAIGLFSYFIFGARHRIDTYADSTQVVFTIKSGESKDIIINDLYEQHLLDSKIYTKIIVKKDNYEFYAGDFGLSESMSDSEVLKIISSPTSNIDTSRQFLITEGSTVYDIAGNLAKFTTADDTSQEILDYWSDPMVLNEIIKQYDFVSEDILNEDILYPLEGYFFPATYNIADDASLESITKLFLDTMQQKIDEIDLSNTKLSTHEVLTLASIVERETLLDSDKPIAAEVFYNRIEAEMPLQSDITVLYAMQKHKEQVLYDDLKYDSPYNTYLNKGLPPGPISTVSVAAINAVANPDDNNYLYFFADQNTGELYFSETLEEHQEVSSEHAWNFEN